MQPYRQRPSPCLCSSAGGECGCSTYSTLLYALSSAVAALLLVVLVLGAIHVREGLSCCCCCCCHTSGVGWGEGGGGCCLVASGSTCTLRACHRLPLQLTAKTALLSKPVALRFHHVFFKKHSSMKKAATCPPAFSLPSAVSFP